MERPWLLQKPQLGCGLAGISLLSLVDSSIRYITSPSG